MRWPPLLCVVSLAACTSGEPSSSDPTVLERSEPGAGAHVAPTFVVPERISVAATRSAKVHVEVSNRSAIDSVMVVEGTRVPPGIEVDQGVIAMTASGTDITVHVPSDMNPSEAYGRIELSLSTVRGVEATAEIVVDIDGAPGRLVRIDSVALARVGGLHVDAQDRVVAVGASSDRATVVRETAKGGPDTTFGAFGSKRLFPASSPEDEPSMAESVASYPDGALVVAGTRGLVNFSQTGVPFVVRLLADGSVDEGFVYAPRPDRRVAGVAVDALDRAVVVLAPSRGAPASIEIVALAPDGSVLAETALESTDAVADVAADASRRVHVALSDGSVLRLSSSFAVEEKTTTKPFSAIAFRRSRGPIFLRSGTIDDGEGFVPEDTDVAVWSAIGAHADGKIVAAGIDFGDVNVARFWP